VAEVVGWDDKQQLNQAKRHQLNRIIYLLQPTEGGVYMTSDRGQVCKNLLFVRRMKKLAKPFSVALLTKLSDGQPVSPKRETAGGWAYVRDPGEEWLRTYL